MSKYFFLEPEVAGELGPDTKMDASQHPPIVKSLHYIFGAGWGGDELVESFPAFMVSERLANMLTTKELTGFELDEAKVDVAPEFMDWESTQPNPHSLPTYKWLKVTGKEKINDFSIVDNKLCVSERALETLRAAKINNCDISEDGGH